MDLISGDNFRTFPLAGVEDGLSQPSDLSARGSIDVRLKTRGQWEEIDVSARRVQVRLLGYSGDDERTWVGTAISDLVVAPALGERASP